MTGRDLIESPTNPIVKRARKLRLRKFREREQAFLIEGIHPVLQALEHNAEVETILLAPQLLTSERARALVESSGVPVKELGSTAFTALAEREHPSGLAAIARFRDRSIEELRPAPEAVYVALHDVGNPGNLGSIIRAADGAGAAAVILSGESTDPWHPSAVKASLGTLFAVPVVRAAGPADVLAWCRKEKVTVVTTSARMGESHYSVKTSRPCLLMLGSEATGLPDAILTSGDLILRIPMRGTATSLNLAVAAGILLYEITKP